MRLKKQVAVALATVMALAIFTACGGSDSIPSASSSSSNSTASSSASSSEEKPDSSSSASSSEAASSSETQDGLTQSNLEAYRQEVLRLVNVERAKEGLQPLTMSNTALSAAAQVRAKELVSLFAHTRPDGTRCFTALDEQGVTYGWAGENIAAGYQTPEAVVSGWMNSPGHRANILNANFKELGVGYYYTTSGYKHYWVQMFIG